MRNSIIITLLLSTLLTFAMTITNGHVTTSKKMLRLVQEGAPPAPSADLKPVWWNKALMKWGENKMLQGYAHIKLAECVADSIHKLCKNHPAMNCDGEDLKTIIKGEWTNPNSEMNTPGFCGRDVNDTQSRFDPANPKSQPDFWGPDVQEWASRPSKEAYNDIKFANCVADKMKDQCDDASKGLNCKDRTINDVLGGLYSDPQSFLRAPGFCREAVPAVAEMLRLVQEGAPPAPSADLKPVWWNKALMKWGENKMLQGYAHIKLAECVADSIHKLCKNHPAMNCDGEDLKTIIKGEWTNPNSEMNTPGFCGRDVNDTQSRFDPANPKSQPDFWGPDVQEWASRPSKEAYNDIKFANCVADKMKDQCDDASKGLNCKDRTINDVLGGLYSDPQSFLRAPGFCREAVSAVAEF